MGLFILDILENIAKNVTLGRAYQKGEKLDAFVSESDLSRNRPNQSRNRKVALPVAALVDQFQALCRIVTVLHNVFS